MKRLRLLILLTLLCFVPFCESRAEDWLSHDICTEANPCPEVARLQIFGGGVPAAPGGGSFTCDGACESATGGTTESSDTIATSSTIDIDSGDLLVAFIGWEDSDQTIVPDSVSDGGSNTFTCEPDTSDGSNWAAFCYKTNATNNDTATITATISASVGYRTIMVYAFNTTGTVTLDDKDVGTGNTTPEYSNTITTDIAETGTAAVVVAGEKSYAAGSYSDHAIGPSGSEVAADGTPLNVGTYSALWYRILDATMTNGRGTVDHANADYQLHIISFKAE